MESTVTHELKIAAKAHSIAEAITSIKKAGQKLSSADAQPLDSKDIKLILRLKQRHDYYLYRNLAIMFIQMNHHAVPQEPEIFIDFINVLCELIQRYSGSEMANSLSLAARNFLMGNKLSLDAEQINAMNELIYDMSYKVGYSSMLTNFIEEIRNNNPIGVNVLIDILSGFPTLNGQFIFIEAQFGSVLDLIARHKSQEILKRTQRILDYYIFQLYQSVRISDHSTPFVQVYCTRDVIHISSREFMFTRMFQLVCMLVNPNDINITQQLLLYLIRLWHVFQSKRSEMLSTVVQVIRLVVEKGSQDFKNLAALIYSAILLDDSLDTQEIQEEPALQMLKRNESFKKSDTLFESDNEVAIEKLTPITLFPIQSVIAPESKFSYTVEVLKPNSIIVWGFAIQNADIQFRLDRTDTAELINLVEPVKVESQEPYNGQRLITSPGFYTFTWDNTYSWFTSKTIRFRISILEPVKRRVAEPSKSNIIKRISHIECDPNVDYLDIGIYISTDTVDFKYASTIVSQPFSEIDEVQDIILAQMQEIDNQISPSVKYIGVVSSSQDILSRLNIGEHVVMTRDTDALAILSQKSYHPHTLIAITVNSGQVQSSVLIKGKFVQDERGNRLGDLKRDDLSQAVVELLCLFGPAFVVISGDFDIEDVKKAVKELVPEHIEKKSVINNAGRDDALLESAYRLYRLLDKDFLVE